MDYDLWKAAFDQWYDRTNRAFVENRASMEMLDELRTRFAEADDEERRRIIETLHRWQLAGNEFQQYDARRLLPEFESWTDDL